VRLVRSRPHRFLPPRAKAATMCTFMAASLLLLSSQAWAAVALSQAVPEIPAEYEMVMLLKMPYISLEMPLRVLSSKAVQKVEYFDGLEVDVSSGNGTYKYAFKNAERTCLYSEPSGGPTKLTAESWKPAQFFPDLSQYTAQGTEIINGIRCQKFTFNQEHGTDGVMADHISFFWDPVLNKPVRWHMHARHVTFGSHTDEYIMDFLSFQAGVPAASALALPSLCTQKPTEMDGLTIQLSAFLQTASRTGLADEEFLFEAFQKKYAKSYASSDEIAYRRQIFEKNARLVRELNKRHAGAASFKGNAFLDMTREEVLSFRGGVRRSVREQRRLPEHRAFVTEHAASSSAPLPTDFDWRAKPGVVSPVKDQGMCGSCWTYGLMGPVESIHAIQSGSLVELPEQFAVDCTWTNNTDGPSNSGCDGGDSDVGALEIVRKYGGIIPSAKAYGSYLSVNGYCKDTRLMETGARISGWVDVKHRDQSGLLDALVNQGPISVGIMVPDDMLYYDSGVLKVESCRHDSRQIDHSVTLVGYGVDEHGTSYYTVRNSWSTYWGDEGYIRIAQGDLDCALSSEAGYPKVAVSTDAVVV